MIRTIRWNLALSLLYNAVGASLAIVGLLSPLIAAVLMPLSSLTVVTISWRTRTFRATRSTDRGLNAAQPPAPPPHSSPASEAPNGTTNGAWSCP